jgi:hypothetical protein
MEGSCAKIVEESPEIVRKVLKKAYKGKCANEQFYLQQTACLIVSECKLKHIVVPQVHTLEAKSYTMDRIDTSKPLYEEKVSREVMDELQMFCTAFEEHGWYVNDIECYIQPSGKIAIIDFDKCEAVSTGTKKANVFLPIYY